jgi:hypothetical protein
MDSVCVNRSSEQRAHARHVSRAPVRFVTDGLQFDSRAELGDIGEQGLFVRSTILGPSGTRVWLRLSLGDDVPIPLEGTVVWVTEDGPKGPGMGIQLCATPQAYLRRLAALAVRFHP